MLSQWHPTPVLLPGKSHGQRSLVGCSPSGRYELDTTERLHFHFSLSHIGEGNDNPLQCSCLENPRDGGAWWQPPVGSHRVGHDWSDLAMMLRRKRESVDAELIQSCLTLCDPVDCNLSGSSVHGIFQARILECISMPASGGEGINSLLNHILS